MSDSWRPQKLQHTRLLCPSLSLWVCSNSCPLSQWGHPTISSSVAPFSSCPQFLPAKFDLHTPFQEHSSSVSNTDHTASKTTSFNSDNTKFNLNYKVCVLATIWIYSIFPLYKILFMNILKTHICKCSIQFKKLQMCGNSICQFKFILFYQILTLGDISIFF